MISQKKKFHQILFIIIQLSINLKKNIMDIKKYFMVQNIFFQKV